MNAAKSFITNNMREKWDGKVTTIYIFQNKCYFPIFFCPLFFDIYVKKCTHFHDSVIIFYIFNFHQRLFLVS